VSGLKDPVLDEEEDACNAMANVIGYQQLSYVRLLVRSGRIVGVWAKEFPGNATKAAFLSAYCMYCRVPGNKAGVAGLDDALNEAWSSAKRRRFEIYRARDGDGFNVRFL
jgi:hypothetical protein